MSLKAMTSAAAAVLAAAAALACHAQTKQGPPQTVESVTISPGANPEQRARLKDLLFADMSLEEVMRASQAGGEAPPEGSWLYLTEADEALRRGRAAEAKGKLRRVLRAPGAETRELLLAWGTLRGLGERPPAEAARQVQGVVLELHNAAGVGTLAAYRDGRVRWIGGQGKVTMWESPGADADIDSLVRELLKAAEPVVSKAPAAAKRMPGEPPRDHFRVSVLTYAGIHAVESYGPGTTVNDPAGAALYVSGRLIEALGKYDDEHPGRPAPAPPGGVR